MNTATTRFTRAALPCLVLSALVACSGGESGGDPGPATAPVPDPTGTPAEAAGSQTELETEGGIPLSPALATEIGNVDVHTLVDAAAGDTPAEVHATSAEVMAKVASALGPLPDTAPLPVPDAVVDLLPAIRMLCSPADGPVKIASIRASALVQRFLQPGERPGAALPFTPDHIVYCRTAPLEAAFDGNPARFLESFPRLLQRWSAAQLISDDSTGDVPPGYRYNQGGFFTSTVNGNAYRLGSINLYNYSPTPYLYTRSTVGWYRPLSTSQALCTAAVLGTGVLDWTLNLPDGVIATVVARP